MDAFCSVSFGLASLSGAWQEGEEHVMDFGVKVDSAASVEVRGWGLRSVRDCETLACMMHSRNTGPGVLSVLKARGVSIPFQLTTSCLPEWSVSRSTEAGRVGRASRPCVCWRWVPGRGWCSVTPLLRPALPPQGARRAQRPREWALRPDTHGA